MWPWFKRGRDDEALEWYRMEIGESYQECSPRASKVVCLCQMLPPPLLRAGMSAAYQGDVNQEVAGATGDKRCCGRREKDGDLGGNEVRVWQFPTTLAAHDHKENIRRADHVGGVKGGVWWVSWCGLCDGCGRGRGDMRSCAPLESHKINAGQKL